MAVLRVVIMVALRVRMHHCRLGVMVMFTE